jgi:hypothetical protein
MTEAITGAIIVAAPAGPGRSRLIDHLEARGAQVRSLERERLVRDGQLCIEDQRVLLDGADLLDGAAAAVVLEPGYMWPLPVLDPTPEQWAAHHGRFDDWLRDERESASLWYSLLAILDARVPAVINPQPAMAHLALPPDALALLREAGAAVAPTITTNDPDALADFANHHPDAALRALPLWPGAPARWVERDTLGKLPLEREPLLLQALSGRQLLKVVAVAGRAVDDRDLPAAATEALAAVHEQLGLGLAEVTFCGEKEALQLCGLGLPDLGDRDEALVTLVLDALWRLLDESE